jgi:hypothetical protein
MRTPTGQYRIDYHNKYGERLNGTGKLAQSIVASHRVAEANWPDEADSYTVHLCVFNSLDKKRRW